MIRLSQQKDGVHDRVNKTAEVVTLFGKTKEDYENTVAEVLSKGFRLTASKGSRNPGEESFYGNEFASFLKGKTAVFVTFFPGTGELRIVEEKASENAGFSAPVRAGKRVEPFLAQIWLRDFSMSYAIRLPDGRFILIDGGRRIDGDVDDLYAFLRRYSPWKKPVIAAWFFTHPHPDHFHLFTGFYAAHKKDVSYERFLLNFPDVSDTAHWPKIQDGKVWSNRELIPEMLCDMKESGAGIYMPHTGEAYEIGDAKFEILSTLEDTVHYTHAGVNHLNITSLVMKMSLCGQTVLFPADASSEHSRLAARYHGGLHADILQMPHHGHGQGNADAELEMIALVNPETLLIPCEWEYTFLYGNQYRKPLRSLLLSPAVREVFWGDETHVLPLPYRPKDGQKEKVLKAMADAEEFAGKRSFVFTGLNTKNPEDFRFTVLNMMRKERAHLSVDLYFEDRKARVLLIKAEALAGCLTDLDILDETVCNPDALAMNGDSLKIKGIPENAPFAVRFISDIPVVITKATEKTRA